MQIRFDAALPTDVKRIVLDSAAKSSKLDPLPSFLLKRHVNALSSILTRIINASLSSAAAITARKLHIIILSSLKAILC